MKRIYDFSMNERTNEWTLFIVSSGGGYRGKNMKHIWMCVCSYHKERNTPIIVVFVDCIRRCTYHRKLQQQQRFIYTFINSSVFSFSVQSVKSIAICQNFEIIKNLLFICFGPKLLAIRAWKNDFFTMISKCVICAMTVVRRNENFRTQSWTVGNLASWLSEKSKIPEFRLKVFKFAANRKAKFWTCQNKKKFKGRNCFELKSGAKKYGTRR